MRQLRDKTLRSSLSRTTYFTCPQLFFFLIVSLFHALPKILYGIINRQHIQVMTGELLEF
ncbi:hypothetical protein BD408DRAFT_422510 [Parasitella parasitica]|nr:hypothetical protein BD408DRAFT_422510 [Parasitella parasitica]